MPSVRAVGLNAMFLDPGVSGGPETYLHTLGEALVRRHPEVRFAIATTRRGAAALRAAGGWADDVAIHQLPADEGQRARRLWAEQALLPRLAVREGWDVLHSVAGLGPVRARVPAVVTLHDVTFLHVKTFSRTTTIVMTQVMRRASRRAEAVVAISRSSRDEVCAAFGLDPDRVAVVPNGPGRPPAGPAPLDATLARHGLRPDDRLVLCVSAKRPHKNQELLVRAARHLPPHARVVLVGHAEPYDRELRELARATGVQDRVRFLDRVSDAEHEALMGAAACVAVPSLAEGFGLPVLEAMRRGVPVACSDIDVFHEVAGDAARWFDPHDPAGAAAAIAAAMDDETLRAAGPAQARRFSWDATADGTFAAYERAVAARRG
jgi:glycosyltransferase involved in cell wall biosynthesis